MTAEQITADLVASLNNDLSDRNPEELIIEEGGDLILPIFWSEDRDQNIYYDIDSIRQNFEELMTALERHNRATCPLGMELKWDNSDEYIAEES